MYHDFEGSYQKIFGSRKSFSPSKGRNTGLPLYFVNVRPLSLL